VTTCESALTGIVKDGKASMRIADETTGIRKEFVVGYPPPSIDGRADHKGQPGLPEGQLYSTVTLLARLRGWSTSHPRRTAIS
jgi:hypothetical protein